MKSLNIVWSLALGGLIALGCATGSPPTERLASTQAAIRSAEEVGAHHVPEAALHLQLAREQSDYARQLMKAGDNDRAAFLLLRAEADAELALAMARESSTQAEAQEALDKVRELQKQAHPGS